MSAPGSVELAGSAASSESVDATQPTHWPEWPATRVGAIASTRVGGVSGAPWASLNLGRSVGDDAGAVAENRRRFTRCLEGARPVWLRHVHGSDVLQLRADTPEHPQAAADGAWTVERGIACVVNGADCMPVLVAAADGSVVGAAHAGWRGLAAGVVESLLAAMTLATGVAAAELRVWLGPCIGARHFEVGEDVLRAFGVVPRAQSAPHFAFTPRADGSPRWHADLPALATARLHTAGVRQVRSSGACTYADASRFFSHRRDGVTGRMATAIWRR